MSDFLIYFLSASQPVGPPCNVPCLACQEISRINHVHGRYPILMDGWAGHVSITDVLRIILLMLYFSFLMTTEYIKFNYYLSSDVISADRTIGHSRGEKNRPPTITSRTKMVEGVRIQDVGGATMGQSDPHEGRWTMGLYQTMRIVSISHHSTF